MNFSDKNLFSQKKNLKSDIIHPIKIEVAFTFKVKGVTSQEHTEFTEHFEFDITTGLHNNQEDKVKKQNFGHFRSYWFDQAIDIYEQENMDDYGYLEKDLRSENAFNSP